jgi:diacylglycerol kinase family enzyme
VRTISAHRARFDEVLTVDGLGRAALALIANCDPYSYAGSIPLHVAPLARFELGLDVVAPRSVRARDLPRLVGYLVRGKGQERAGRMIYAHDLDRLVIRCDRALPLHVDGEDVGDVEEAVCEAERDAVSVLV